MSDANREMPADAPPARACAQCAYLEQTARGSGNRSSYTSYCTKFGTNAHEERGVCGTCGPLGTSWEAIGTEVTQQYTRVQPTAPEVSGTQISTQSVVTPSQTPSA